MTGKRTAVEEIFEHIEEALIKSDIRSDEEVMQIFCMVRFILESVVADSGLDREKFSLNKYRKTEPIESLFSKLGDKAFSIMDGLEAKKHNINKESKERIILYIRENYTSSEIYAESIAEKFNVSRNYIYNLVREVTGNSLNEYIENLRMDRALELLKTTDINISDISVQCGYNSPNTFYKAFKKHYNMSPSMYR
jgi:AraC-like DNA-binding protein